jgi:hypothetical protein
MRLSNTGMVDGERVTAAQVSDVVHCLNCSNSCYAISVLQDQDAPVQCTPQSCQMTFLRPTLPLSHRCKSLHPNTYHLSAATCQVAV